jgi:acyl-CoA hydrolase
VPAPSNLLDHFRPGSTVYVPGATGELRFLAEALAAEPERLAGVGLVSCLVPGMNSFDYAALHPRARLTTFLLPPALRASFEAGRVRVLPLAYTAAAEHLAALEPDVAVLHVTPAQNGLCSFGTCADFGPLVAPSARRRIGVINPCLPRPLNAPTIPLDAFDAVVEADEPPATHTEGTPSPELLRIADRVAELVPDGAAVQTGIGSAPAAVWRALSGRRGLRLRSGMVTDGFLHALDAGAMVDGGHLAGVAFGTETLYARMHASDQVVFADVRTTHGAPALGDVDRFTAINSALELDLLGQANLEWQGGRLISGLGGAPDFNAAARRSPGGCSILALPSTARGGSISRISVRLNAPAASLGRGDLDTVVTEHGVARLLGLSMDERAEALIAIAAPHHQAELQAGWEQLRRGF